MIQSFNYFLDMYLKLDRFIIVVKYLTEIQINNLNYYSISNFKKALNIACYSLNDYIINIKACRVNYRQKNTQRLG